MGNSARRHFCCCIPVRFAVFVSSLLLFLSSGAVAASAFWTIWAINNDPAKLNNQLNNSNLHITFTKGWKIGIIVCGAVFSLVCIISLFGFIGAISRNRRMVKAYSTMTYVALLVSCVGTGFFLYAIFSNNKLIKCYDLHGNSVSCSSISTGTKAGITVINIVALLIELYLCVVISRYVDQLEDEQSYRSDFGLSKTSSYYPHQPLDASTNPGLLNPHGYQYTDQIHSHGNVNH